ncbi:uncharacterized protein LOC144153061 isoform X2 [Haemaphysalis longicornis]
MKDVRSLLKGGATPGPDWSRVRCCILQTYENYKKAHDALRKAEETSDLQSDEDLGRGKRKRQPRRISSSEDEDLPLPQPPQAMFNRHMNERRPTSESAFAGNYLDRPDGNDEDVPYSPQINSSTLCTTGTLRGTAFCSQPQDGMRGAQLRDSPRPGSCNSWYAESCSTSLQRPAQLLHDNREEWPEIQSARADRTSKFQPAYIPHENRQDWSNSPEHRARSGGLASGNAPPARSFKPSEFEQLMRAIHTIEMRCEQHGRQLDAIIRKLNSDNRSPARDRDEEVLEQPFQNIEDFENFDAGLGTNGQLKTSLVHQLAGLGGSAAAPATRRILEAIMSQRVAVRYSWLGQKGKKKFSVLNVASLIIKAVKQNFADAKQAEIEAVIKTWLRHSGEKLKKLEAKTASARDEGNVNYMECWFGRTWQRIEGLRQGAANRHTEGTNFFVIYWFYNALKLT